MIIRTSHHRRFTVIADDTIRDPRLSFRATGILAYLLSLPDHSEITGLRIAALKREGRDAVYAALKELESAGYLKRERRQDPQTRRWYHVQTLAEVPGNQHPFPGFQESANQESANQEIKTLEVPTTKYLEPSSENPNPETPPLPRSELAERTRALRGGLRPVDAAEDGEPHNHPDMFRPDASVEA